VLTIIDLNS